MKEKTKNIIISVIFFTVFIGTFIINLVKKDDTISISERRKLEQFPQISLTNILNGTLFKKFDNYATDQFILREYLRSFKSKLDLELKKNYHNIYVKDDHLIEILYPMSENSMLNLTKKITYIKENYLKQNDNIYFSIIPDKNYFVNDNLIPKIDYYSLKNNMQEQLSYATYIDIFNELNLNDYYKTDSHWKQESLVNVANKILKSMNAPQTFDYTKESITDFKGSYAYKLPIQINNERLNILHSNTIDSAKVYNYLDNNYTSIYNLNKINSLDKYDIYLSGSQPLLTLYNNSNKSDRELIIFRDSFASSLAPLFLESYYKVTLIDTRYISPSIIGNYINFKEKNTDILFIYNVSIINNSYSLK